MKRRKFLNHLGAISTGLVCGGSFLPKSFTEDTVKVTILHTNDTHSRIDPFPDYAGKLAGKGGAAARSAYIKAVRSNEEHVLLLDAGDIWQGTPYFNTYKGRLEFELMSKMQYDAATLGNHDFDLGIEGLKAQWDVADFPFICTNYDFSDTALEGLTQNYIIIKKSKIKIGILGVGIQLDGLVPDSLFSGLRYLDPVQQANHMARKLKRDMDCDFVITLSHLGYQYTSDKISDRKLARHSEYIDLIIGGHTHTFLDGIQVVKNKKGEDVAINQVGHGGAMIGHIDLWFDGNKKKRSKDCQNCWV